MHILRTRTLHADWSSVFVRLQQVGMLSGLGTVDIKRLLGQDAGHAPTPVTIGTLVRRWYAADGDWVEALWRRQRDSYVEIFDGQLPGDIAMSVVHARPSLEGLRASITPAALLVELDDDRVTVSRVVRHARLANRERRQAVARPENVMQAINVLASRRDDPLRFVEVVAGCDRRAFLATSLDAARELWHVGATRERDLDVIWAMAAWDRELPQRAAC